MLKLLTFHFAPLVRVGNIGISTNVLCIVHVVSNTLVLGAPCNVTMLSTLLYSF